jgi:RNA recognition motif-containing protein
VDAFSQVPLASETVYIGNLFYDLTAEDLRKHMEKYGTVINTYIVHDSRGLSKG